MSRTTTVTRTCVYVRIRACTRDDRYDNSRRRTHTHTGTARRRTPIEEYPKRMWVGWWMVPPFGGGPFLAVLRRASFRFRGSLDERERSGLLLLRGSASLKSSIYLSIFITARSLPPLHPLSLCLSLALFFFLSSLLISSGSLSGLVSPFR